MCVFECVRARWVSTRKIKHINLCFVKKNTMTTMLSQRNETEKKPQIERERGKMCKHINFRARNIGAFLSFLIQSIRKREGNLDLCDVFVCMCVCCFGSFDFNKLFCYDCVCVLGVCRLQWNAALVLFSFLCLFLCSFTPFNRIFIAMNQSSLAALTTSCSLITFDGKVTNQPEQRNIRTTFQKYGPRKSYIHFVIRTDFWMLLLFFFFVYLFVCYGICNKHGQRLWQRPALNVSEIECKQYINLIFTFSGWDILCAFTFIVVVVIVVCVPLLSFRSISFVCSLFGISIYLFLAACTVRCSSGCLSLFIVCNLV